MNSDTSFNLLVFTDSTKKICLCSAISIFIIVMFIISPLSYFIKTSIFMKLLTLILLIYTIYLSYEQIKALRDAVQIAKSEQVKSQLNMNILCSYIFTFFIGLLVIFIIKSLL
jgi:uncharacterized membrane protein YfcA